MAVVVVAPCGVVVDALAIHDSAPKTIRPFIHRHNSRDTLKLHLNLFMFL